MATDLDLVPDPVLVLDADLRLASANAAACTLLGDLEARYGTIAGDALGAKDVTGRDALRAGMPPAGSETELTFADASGTDVAVRVTWREAADGRVVVAARPVGDKTGIAIVSTVSHELRSPLTSVKGYVSLMLNRWDRIDDAKKREMLEQVHHDADRVTRLVTELLDISRLETGRLVLRREMVDLEALTNSVLEKVTMSYPTLECSVDFATLPEVYVDGDKIEQVLTNLIENAAKYASPVGMSLRATVDDGMARISVTDRGEGIAPHEVDKVFSKFYRGGGHGRPSGTGLGLWISRGLVEAHEGELVAESAEGKGSTFSFTVPLDAFERIHG